MMSDYQIKLELKSPALVGAGVGFGAGIDSDVVFDDFGLPYIPAKRIKGCLRDAAQEVREIFKSAGIAADEIQVTKTFGDVGTRDSAPVYFSNLCLENHKQTQKWLRYFADSNDYKYLITPERILETFTKIRQQTRIDDDGVAFEHSLRTIRVLQKGLVFFGQVRIETDDEQQVLNTLLFACRNFRRFGTKRNRGFGEVTCTLLDKNNQLLSIDAMLEGLCTA
jgi:CRISPR-associated protein Csx10